MATIMECLRRRSGTFMGLASVATAGAILFGGIAPSQAEEQVPCESGQRNVLAEESSTTDDVSAQAMHNGYCIKNFSTHTLVLVTNLQDKGIQTYKNGWGDEPPREIKPDTSVYFEVKYRWTPDDSFLTYDVKDAAGNTVGKVKFEAKVDYLPGRGGSGFLTPGNKDKKVFEDYSTCSSEGSGKCIPEKSAGRGYQTVFEFKNTFQN